MSDLLLGIVIDRWPVVAIAAVTFLGVVIARSALSRAALAKIPVVGEDARSYLTGAKKLYTEGYRKFKDGVFRIKTSRESPVVVVSPMYLAELKKLPDDVLSMSAAVDETMETKYTRIRTSVPIIPVTIKTDLTPALLRLNPMIFEETKESMNIEMPPCNDWTEVNIHHKLLRMVGMISGRIFIGPELCRTEKYLDAAINYTTDVMAAQKAVASMKPWEKWIKAPFLPQLKKLDQRIAEADAFLRPVVEARVRAVEEGGPDYEKPDDMLQWLIDAQEKTGKRDVKELALVQLGLGFAAIHTTTLTATNVFYNIAAMPEILPELREEALTALRENGGVLTSAALQSMKKLDSLLKETLRYHPVTFASFQRKTLRQFTLPNGQVIPAGVTIEVPAYSVNYDPNVFPEPEKFDPLRFYTLRQEALRGAATGSKAAEAAAQNQFVSVSQNSLTFGYGRHACPGRFFAANEIKMILATAMLKYDIRCVKGSEGRYKNMEFAHMSIPDPTKTLLFKRVAS